jgi:hypothetical protein
MAGDGRPCLREALQCCSRIGGRSVHCLHLAYYNFCRIHKTLRVTPAMGIEAHGSRVAWNCSPSRVQRRIL